MNTILARATSSKLTIVGSSISLNRSFYVRFDPKRPREPNFEKKLLLAVMEPAFRQDRSSDSEKCRQYQKSKVTQELHPYIQILAKECREQLQKPFVYLLHMNSMSKAESKKFNVTLLKNELHLCQHKAEVLEHALAGSRYTKLYNLLTHFGAFCYADTNKLTVLNGILKKQSNAFLLGGIAENRIMNKDQLIEYTNLPSLDAMRAQLCHTLDSPLIALRSSLDHHTTDLSSNLQRLVESNQSSSSSSS